ncbi:MAG TPA: ABC transporter substrate-binding protein [Streptosporangiaceae bacterium]
MQRRKKATGLVAIAAAVMLAAAACGGGGGGSKGGGGSAKKALVIGTTDAGVTTVDPAGSYDLPSSTIQYNVFQLLLKIPPGGNKPVPDAAQSCDFTDPKTFKCTLKSGLKFSNGDPLTSQDVKFSYDRLIAINDPNGTASAIYGTAGKGGKADPEATVEAPDPQTVIFHLKAPDATWPVKLTYSASGIVDHAVFPADKKLDDTKVIGSGPYKLTKFQKGQQAVFEANPNYSGDTKPKVPNVIVRYYQQSSALKLAIEQGEVDVAYRSLSPTEIKSLQGESSKGVSVVAGNGTEIRYLVFNVKKAPFDKKEVRQALAQVINRDDIANNVYNGTVQPLYSLVPQGLDGHTDAFKEQYGAAPDPAKAKALIQQAGLTTPVPITMWYTPSHYGPASADELNQIKRTLDASGVFSVTLKNTEWEQYQDQYHKQIFQVFQLGWFPDYPDPDDYLSPFLVKGGFFDQNYDNPTADKVIGQEQKEPDLQKRIPMFEQVQKITAEDVPVLPLWQAKQVAAVRSGVTGVETTFDPSFTFRFYVIDKK